MPADRPEELSLAGGFPAATRDQWRDLVDGVIGKGLAEPTRQELDKRYDKTLVTSTYDGLRIQPLYDLDDDRSLPDPGLPGAVPFVRGRTPLGSALGGWEVCQRVEAVGDSGKALAELEGGAGSLWLGLTEADDVGEKAVDRLLDGVLLDLISIRLDAGDRTAEAADGLFAVWDRRDIAAAEARGALGFDPIGWSARSGALGEELVKGTAVARSWADRCVQSRPQVRALTVDGTVYHRAGASDAEELGCSLAVGLAYLRDLTGAGLDVDSALSQLELRLAATSDQFSTIAKLRAARRLWNRLGEVAGATVDVRVPVTHAVTSPAMLSVYDPWVNLLRTTVAAFSAGIGGADAVTVLPYDFYSAGPGSTELGRRLARNIQTLLLEESHLSRVVDLAGGSWYVESLTDGLARRAWEWFQAIEAADGMVAALTAGVVQERLAATWAARAERLAKGADPLTGVSEFPNVGEPVPDPGALATAVATGGTGRGLPSHRWPAEFEAQRGRSDRAAATGRRPAILLATIGTPANYTARSTFAQNLFGVAGIESIQPDDARRPGAWSEVLAGGDVRLACICSDDRTYAEHAADAARRLKAAGAARVYLAGRPGDRRDEWEAAGVDEFVYLGVDRLEVLARALEAGGVR